jgi:hypothetical protein
MLLRTKAHGRAQIILHTGAIARSSSSSKSAAGATTAGAGKLSESDIIAI